jgi:hypothetical protein
VCYPPGRHRYHNGHEIAALICQPAGRSPIGDSKEPLEPDEFRLKLVDPSAERLFKLDERLCC